jgi:hypothetical protein
LLEDELLPDIEPDIDRKSAMKSGGVAWQDFTEARLGDSWYRQAMDAIISSISGHSVSFF